MSTTDTTREAVERLVTELSKHDARHAMSATVVLCRNAASTLSALLKRCESAEADAMIYRARMVEVEAERDAYLNGGLTEEILRRRDGHIKVGHGCAIVAAAEYDDLRARLEAEKNAHSASCADAHEECDKLEEQLTAAQAREARLREALEECVGRLETMGSMTFRDRLACNEARAALADGKEQP